MSDRLRVGVFFGGRSVEHEVSVVTGLQVLAALDASSYRTVPVYIAKSGRWFTGEALRDLERFRDVEALLGRLQEVRLEPAPRSPLRLELSRPRPGLLARGRGGEPIDVAIPVVHGSHGEDGTLQGLFELCDLAYTGCDVAASAVSMHKPLTKAVLRDAGLPVSRHVLVERSRWRASPEQALRAVLSELGHPMFVKPASLGSSIGVSRASDERELGDALELAFVYDERCLVESAQEGAVDVNCSVLGDGAEAQASVCEQPLSSGLLTYADKYLSKGTAKQGGAGASGMKGARRIIPAPLPDALTQRIGEAAVAAFHAIGAAGVARVDFLVHPHEGSFVVNEVNTIPGSLAYYLWEPSGVTFAELLGRVIDIAQRRHQEKRSTAYSIDTWLLRGRPD